jgi:hypothetical protein
MPDFVPMGGAVVRTGKRCLEAYSISISRRLLKKKDKQASRQVLVTVVEAFPCK